MLFRQQAPQRRDLDNQGPEIGPPLEHLVDLPHQRPGPGHVGQREVDTGQLEPGLHSHVRVGQMVLIMFVA